MLDGEETSSATGLNTESSVSDKMIAEVRPQEEDHLCLATDIMESEMDVDAPTKNDEAITAAMLDGEETSSAAGWNTVSSVFDKMIAEVRPQEEAKASAAEDTVTTLVALSEKSLSPMREGPMYGNGL